MEPMNPKPPQQEKRGMFGIDPAIGRAIQGMGEGFAGRGSQWRYAQAREEAIKQRQAQAEEKARQIRRRDEMMAEEAQRKEMERQRMTELQGAEKDAAFTLMQLESSLDSGDVQGFQRATLEHARAVQAMGGDPRPLLEKARDPVANKDFLRGQYFQPMRNRLGMDMPEQKNQFETLTGAQVNERFGAQVPPDALYRMGSDGKIEGVGGAGTSIEVNTSPGQQQGRFFTDALDNASSQLKLFRNEANTAGDKLTRIRTLQQLNTDNPTGLGVKARMGMGRALDAVFGEGTSAELINTDVPALQAFQAISQKMVNEELNEAKGPQTDGDAIRATQTVASIDKETQANKFLLSYLEGIAERTRERDRFFRERVPMDATTTNEQGLRAYQEAEQQWQQFKESTPLIARSVARPNANGQMQITVTSYANTSTPMVYYDFERLFVQNNRDKLQGMSAAEKRAEAQQVWRQLNGVQ